MLWSGLQKEMFAELKAGGVMLPIYRCIWLVCAVLLRSKDSTCNVFAPGVECSPRLDFVETDPESRRYLPYITELYRCRGANNDPTLVRCAPVDNANELLDMTVFNLASGETTVLRFVNHTSCREVCLRSANDCNEYQVYDSGSCECICVADDKTKNSCRPPFQWSSKNCNCSCPHHIRSQACASNKTVFSELYCGCFCREEFYRTCAESRLVLDQSTCGCRAPLRPGTSAASGGCTGGVSKGILALVIIFEAAFFVTGYFLLRECCYKKHKTSVRKFQPCLS